MNIKHYTNQQFTYLNNFYNIIYNSLPLRQKALDSHRLSSVYKENEKSCLQQVSNRPNWHFERNLANTVITKGLGHFIHPFDKQLPDFDEALKLGESLMISQSSFNGDLRRLFDATLNVKKHCMFPSKKFRMCSTNFVGNHVLNKSAKAGFPLFLRKGLVIPELITQANLILTEKLQPWFWPMIRGFRLQLRESKNSISRKTRLIYPYPGSLTLLEACFAFPFIQHFIKSYTFYVTGKNGFQTSIQLKNNFHNSNKIVSTDITAYDQTMTNEVIICAFWILRSQLQLSRSQSICFCNLVHYFCTSYMVSKQSGQPIYTFIKQHGIPSGSGFTNLIGSICHAIILEYHQKDILKTCLICGDDNIFDYSNTNLDDLYNTYSVVFNLNVSKEKTQLFNSPKKISFLGFNWINFEKHISYKLVINQIIWHADFRTDLNLFERELARAASVILNGKNGAKLFEKLFPMTILSLQMGLDYRFVYIHGFTPPHKSIEFSPQDSPSINRSLKLHLEKGYLIR